MECGKIHRFGVLDDRDDERAAPVLLLDVHREAQANGAGVHAVRLAVDLLKGMRHDPEVFGGLDDRVPDQVSERDLLPARGQLGVERLAAGVKRGRRDVAEGRSRGDREGLGHVRHEPGGGACNRGREPGVRSRDRLRGGSTRLNCRSCGPGSRLLTPGSTNDRQLRELSVIKQLPPLLTDGGGVAQVFLVHDLYEGGLVGTKHEFAHGLESIRYLM